MPTHLWSSRLRGRRGEAAGKVDDCLNLETLTWHVRSYDRAQTPPWSCHNFRGDFMVILATIYFFLAYNRTTPFDHKLWFAGSGNYYVCKCACKYYISTYIYVCMCMYLYFFIYMYTFVCVYISTFLICLYIYCIYL